ncbi:unnamed protein product [Clonostachys solani]|uniref:J domain-containing protein n=1 Tax=Clonostachys solani TaxID=160281 RepID=A0A9N9W2Y7_9HYPO|nr:unnamed protein product [Clonostachys solani]
MSPLPDHYAILGVAKDAQIPEIRSAHRKLVLKCHPDKVQDPTLKAEKQDEFQKVQTAYEVLSSEKERRRYDDSLRLAELKAQLQNKANSSAPRKYDIKVSESRSSHKPASGSPNVRVFTTYVPSSYDEDKRSRSQSRSRYYDHEPRHSSKREASYTEKPSKREADREREREREREKEKEQRDKERRRREKREKDEEELRRAQKKEKKEKKEREKAKSKDIKKGSEEKRQERYAEDIFVEHEDEYIPKPEKKKSSSSKKHEEKRERDRSVHRDEPSPRFPDGSRASFAQEYIRMARREDPVYYSEKPSAPTPPPPRSGPHSPPKDDDIRRSSARRTSPEGYKEKSRRKASREQLDDEDEPHLSASPPKYSTSPPALNRTNSVPLTSSSRPIPVGRSKTFANYGDGGESPRSDRGRHRSKHHAQPTLDEESDSEEDHDHERRHRSSKHRSSKKHRSPEGPSEFRYHVNDGRSHLYSTSYSFNNRGEYEPTSAAFGTSPYYPEFDHPTRPPMHARDSGYGGSGSYYDRVKTSKSYGVDDIAFSSYPSASYGGEYQVPA